MNAVGNWPTTIMSLQAPGALEEALYWLGRGQAVAFPTDTVYGLGVPMDDVTAVERLYQIKERPHSMGIPLLLAELADVERVCCDIPDAAWQLAERFWPGGLTLVLLRRSVVPDLVTAGLPSVAVRLPNHDVPRELARRLEVPLAASSANVSGQPVTVTAEAVREQLAGRVPLILDGGPCPEAQASTIIDLTAEPPAVLRAGPVPYNELEAILGRPLLG